jgi:hypothetical protein
MAIRWLVEGMRSHAIHGNAQRCDTKSDQAPRHPSQKQPWAFSEDGSRMGSVSYFPLPRLNNGTDNENMLGMVYMCSPCHLSHHK